MDRKIRVGVVGYGFRGAGLFGMAANVDAFEPAAVCETDPALRARVKADHPGAVFFDDYEAMLASGRIEAVLIETPPMSHARLAIAALEQDIHVLSDVPAIHTLDEAQPLWDAAEKSRAVYMFGSTADYFGTRAKCDDFAGHGPDWPDGLRLAEAEVTPTPGRMGGRSTATPTPLSSPLERGLETKLPRPLSRKRERGRVWRPTH